MHEGSETAPDGEPPTPIPTLASLRERLATDLAEGRTVQLLPEDLADPDLRERLPHLLEDLARARPDDPLSLLEVPGYTVLGEIGQGGMSTVYLARHEKLGRYVALKVAPNWLGGQKRARERLLNEAQAMARVSDRHIVAIHDIVEHGDSFVLAMEWVDGLSLGALLRQLGPDRHNELARIRRLLGAPDAQSGRFEGSAVRFFVHTIADVARAVQRVHDANLLHLDIKPTNVLLRRDGTALLADFGVVREITTDITSTRSFAGTPLYAAPEQLRRDDRVIGAPTDVYGLGMTLYEALARQTPVDRQDLTRLYRDLAAGRIARLSSHVDVAKDLEVIVHRAIDHDPKQRYATAAAFADDLEAFLEHRPIAARAPTRWQTLKRWARAEPWRAALATALVVLVPAMLVLGVVLYAEMPRIEAARRDEQRRAIVHQRQIAAQNHFFALSSEAGRRQALRAMIDFDPSDESLAYFAGFLVEEDVPLVRDELANRTEALARRTSLRMLFEQTQRDEQFYDAAQLAELQTSVDPVDLIAVALDRLRWAEQSGGDDGDYQVAARHLEHAYAALPVPDPLLIGLCAYCAWRADEPEALDGWCRALQIQRPDDPDCLLWEALLNELRKPARAAMLEQDLVDREPDNARYWECAVGGAFRTDQPQRVVELCERAAARGIASQKLDSFHLRSLCDLKQHDAAIAYFGKLDLAAMDDSTRLRALSLCAPKQATAACEEILARDHMPAALLSSVFEHARTTRDLGLAGKTVAAMEKHYPQRRGFDKTRMFYYGALTRDRERAYAIAKEFRIPRVDADEMAEVVLPVLATMCDWRGLRKASERAMQLVGSGRQATTFYHGLALTRLDRGTEALEEIDESLRDADYQSHWQCLAALELAWLLVTPDMPAKRHDPARALKLVDAYYASRRSLPAGPWSRLVVAEVYFANGQRDKAIRTAEIGVQQAGVKDSGPEGCDKLLANALARYRKD